MAHSTGKSLILASMAALMLCLTCTACQSHEGAATVTYVLGDEQSESAHSGTESEPGSEPADATDSHNSAEAASPEPAHDGDGDGDATIVALETDDVRITMPAELADRCTWSQPGDELVSCAAPDGQVICTVSWGEVASHGNEAKGEQHLIGEVSHGSIGLAAFFFAFGLDEAGDTIYAGLDVEPASLATEHYLGTSVEEVISWIELASADGWEQAAIHDEDGDTSDSAAASSSGVSANAPFWGIWIGASKDPGEAQGMADTAAAQGFDAHVELTTDWQNLNSEPWYVVAVGYAPTEEQANAQVSAVQSAGWDGAYVKYSGEHA